MASAVTLREEDSAAELRRLAAATRNANQSRRLLSLAAVLDAMNRTQAARIGGMDRQTLRDWGHRFKALGPDGLLDRWSKGPEPRLSQEQRAVTAQLSQGGGRPAGPLGRAHRLPALWRVTQARLKAPKAKPNQRALDPVDQTRALADQVVALAAWALGILLVQGRDGHQAAGVGLAAAPAQNGTLEPFGIEPVGFGPPVLARDGNAVGVDRIGFEVAGPEPTCEPEAVATGFKGHSGTWDRAPSFGAAGPAAPPRRT